MGLVFLAPGHWPGDCGPTDLPPEVPVLVITAIGPSGEEDAMKGDYPCQGRLCP
jgi:hypothetical protein